MRRRWFVSGRDGFGLGLDKGLRFGGLGLGWRVGLEHALDFGGVQMVAVEQEEGGLPALFASEEKAQAAAAFFERFEFVIRQGEAFAHPQEMDGRWGVADAAGEAEIFGAAAGEEVRVVAGHRADGCQDVIQVFCQRNGEEVVQIRDLVADGDLGEAGCYGEVFEGDAQAPVGDEDVAGGFYDIVSSGAFAGGWGGACLARRDLGTHEAGWDVFHGGRVGFFSVLWQGVCCAGVVVGVLASGLCGRLRQFCVVIIEDSDLRHHRGHRLQ